MRTQTSLPGEAVNSYSLFRNASENFGQTNVGNTVRRYDIFGAAPDLETDSVAIDESARSLRLSISETPVQVEKKELKKSVDGVVGKYDEATVTCDLRLKDKSVAIQLPRALFPDELRYGLPITVEMTEEGGIRRPVVTIREITPEGTEAIAKEFDSILEQL